MMGPVPDASPRPYTTAGWAAQLPERPNIRVAIRWAREAGDSELFADLVNSAGDMWNRLGPRDELDEWLQQMIADPDTPPGRVVDALVRRAWLLHLHRGRPSRRRGCWPRPSGSPNRPTPAGRRGS